jgi:hypothetical protein
MRVYRSPSTRRRFRLLAALVLVISSVAVTGSRELRAAEQGGGTGARAEIAKCVSETGTIWRREAKGKPWQAVKQGEALRSGDLLIGLAGAALDSGNGAVRLTFPANLSGTAPLPIVESAVVLRESKNADLEFALDRGRVDIINQKKEGEARVRMRIQDRDRVAEAVLGTPGTRAALMLIGRWPAGVPFTKTPKPNEGPTLHLIFLVMQGRLQLSVDARQVAMSAPPGPAMIQWDSVTGGDPSPERCDKLPAWAADQSALTKDKQAILEEFRQMALKESIATALDNFVQADDPLKRRLAVFAMGALDDLPRLGQAVAASKHRDVWENAVLALRHWIGRAPGQDQKLYAALVKDRNYTQVDARSVLQLLHDFGEPELARPELYETLIDFLEHEKLAVRGLAHWHLTRLAPAGRAIAYDPLAAPETRSKAVAQWRTLIPPGQVPPRRTAPGSTAPGK